MNKKSIYDACYRARKLLLDSGIPESIARIENTRGEGYRLVLHPDYKIIFLYSPNKKKVALMALTVSEFKYLSDVVGSIVDDAGQEFVFAGGNEFIARENS